MEELDGELVGGVLLTLSPELTGIMEELEEDVFVIVEGLCWRGAIPLIWNSSQSWLEEVLGILLSVGLKGGVGCVGVDVVCLVGEV